MGGVSHTNDMYPISCICNICFQIKEQNSSKISQNSLKFYHSLELPTNKLHRKFWLDMWKKNEIISRKPQRDEQTVGHTDITVPLKTAKGYNLKSKQEAYKSMHSTMYFGIRYLHCKC
jgi:hypothetical protein